MSNGNPGSCRTRLLSLVVLATAGSLGTGCAAARPERVSPDEIPALEARLAREPRNAEVLLRYAAALFASGQCDTATAVARTGMGRDAKSAIGPLVVGQCYERQQEWDQALNVYRRYLAQNADERGSGAVRAREVIAQRGRAADRARLALQRETELAQQEGDPRTLAVLPVDIVGDSTYRPLSRGLAQILTSDLALIQRFQMVERLQVGALLDEMQIGQSGRVDPTTAARVGRLLQAGRMVQGLAAIPEEGETRLEATVVLADGQVTAPAVESGEFRQLLDMEKRLVVGIAARLGYQLSQAELNLILENGTQSLTAFLAYSRALEAEDLGDYNAAAMHYQESVRADPGFRAAQQGFQETASASAAEQAEAGDVTVVASEAPPEPILPTALPGLDAMTSTVSDIASVQSEQVAAPQTSLPTTGTTTSASQPPPTPTVSGTPVTGTGTIRIFFRLP